MLTFLDSSHELHCTARQLLLMLLSDACFVPNIFVFFPVCCY